MSARDTPPVLPFAAPASSGLRVEVQPFDRDHFNVRIGEHAHHFFELLVVEAGSGRHRLHGEEVSLSAGDVVTLAPGARHDCRGSGSLRGWLILFCSDAISERSVRDHGETLNDPRFSAFFDAGAPASRLRVGGSDLLVLGRQVEALRAACTLASDAERRLASAAWLDLVLLELHRHGSAGSSIGARGDQLVSRVLAIIDQRYADPLSLSVIAAELGISPSHLTLRVRRATGTTVQQWIIRRRLAAARHLLTAAETPVADVVRAVGYLDVSHFNRHFRREHGVGPGTWRAARRPGQLPIPP